MDLGLQGKRALVTGGSRGIGKAIAAQLAREGALVAIVARDLDRLRAAAEEIGGHAVQADLVRAEDCANAFRAAESQLGGVDILVNNLGGRAGSGWDDTGAEEFAAAMDTNLMPAVRLTQLALPEMRRRRWGRVLVVASIWGREAGGAPAYNAAKAAELSLVTALGREVAADGVTVNALAPGSVAFPGGGWQRRLDEDPAGMREFIRRELPRGSFGTPEEVASVAAFLCSERAGYVNAACWAVDGGQSRTNL